MENDLSKITAQEFLNSFPVREQLKIAEQWDTARRERDLNIEEEVPQRDSLSVQRTLNAYWRVQAQVRDRLAALEARVAELETRIPNVMPTIVTSPNQTLPFHGNLTVTYHTGDDLGVPPNTGGTE